jgi:NADP-dependent 3-hydroxy acid dehydrogenase YdfG
MASGLYQNGARVYIVGRREEVLNDTVKEIQDDGQGWSIVA